MNLSIGTWVRWTRGERRGTVTGYHHRLDCPIPEMVTLVEFLGDDGKTYHDWPSNLERVE